MTLLNLWRHLRELQRTLSARLPPPLPREFLHPLRVREWEDLVEQLRQSIAELGMSAGDEDAAAARRSRPGLDPPCAAGGPALARGVRSGEGRDYTGARGALRALARLGAGRSAA